MNSQLYKEVIKQGEVISPNPEGLSDHIPQSKTDQVIIKQNNTIILLLLKLNENLEKLIKEKDSKYNKDELNQYIEKLIKIKYPPVPEDTFNDLIEQLKKVEVTPNKDKAPVIRTQKPWTLFQVGEQTKTDQDIVTPKTN